MSIGTVYKTKINELSQPSVSPGSASVGSLNQGWKMFGEKSYITVDVYYAVRPTMAAPLCRTYRRFSYHYSINNTVYNNYLHSIYIVLTIISI